MGAIGVVGGQGGLSPEDSNSLENLSTNSKGFLDGINESKSIAQKQLNYVSDIAVDVGTKGWFAETLGKLVDNFEENTVKEDEGRTLSEEIKDILSDMKIFEETTNIDNKEKKKKRGKVSDRTKLDDLKSLPYEFATLGAVLVNALTNKDEKKDKKGGISGFFKGLLEGVGGIAALGVALFAFADATLIFNFVDWGKAVIGMLAFTVFTIGMVALAKNLSEEQKDLTKFVESSLIMSAALGAFAISLYIASFLMSGKPVYIGDIELPAFSIGGAIAALVSFGLFELGMVGLAKLMGGSEADFMKFAAGSMIMTAALVTFSIGLVIASNIFANGINLGGFAKYINGGADNTVLKVDPIGAIAAIGTFIAFEAGLGLVARIMGSSTGDFRKFAAGSIIMSGALVAFAISLVVVSHLFTNGVNIDSLNIHLDPVDPKMALLGVGTFIAFMIAMAVLGAASQSILQYMAILGAVSMLMSVSLILFAGAMAVVASVVSGESLEVAGIKFQPPQGVVKNAFIGLAAMAGFMVAFAGLGALFLVPFAGAALAAGIAIASGILISIAAATVLMSKAMMLAGLAITGGTAEIAGEKYNLAPYNEANVDKFFSAMEHFIDRFKDMGDGLSKKSVKAIKMVNDAVMPIIKSMDKMVDVVIKAGENYDNIIKIVNGDSNALDHLMDPVMYVILGHKLDGEGGLMYVANNMSKYSAKVLKLVGEALVPITDAMLNMIDVVIKAADNKQKIEDIMSSQGGMDMLDHLMDPVLWMILGHNMDGLGGLMYVATYMSSWSAKTLKLVIESMVPLTEAMSNMIDIVLKAATLSAEGMTTEELVALAMDNLNLIMVGNGTIAGFLPMFVATASKLDDTSKDAIEAINSMPPMVQALGDIIGVVAKAGELDPAKIDAGIYGLTAASNFLKTFIKTIADIIPGGVGGFFTSMFEGDPLEKVKDAHKYLQPGGIFYNIFEDLANIAKNFDGKGFENLGKVSIVGSFTTDMLKGSDNFKDIMKNIQKGIDNLSKPQSMTTVANALETISNAGDISHKFDPIYELIEKSVSIHSTAQDLESIANSYNKIAAAEKIGDMSSRFKGVFGIKSSTPTTAAAPAAAADNMNRGMSVEEILNDWYKNGVKIKQNLENVKEEPKPVNLLSID